VKVKRVIAPMILAMLLGSMLVQLPLAIASRAGEVAWFDPIIDVRRILLDNYVTPIDEHDMQLSMIDGMLEILDDPNTTYIPHEDEAKLEKALRGTYVGIDAEVNIADGYLTIVSPMDGSPALEAGILAGDTVLAIEDVSTLNMTVQDCIDLLLGEPETTVTLSVRHIDGTEADIEVARRHIVTPTVRGLRRIGEAWDYCIDEDLALAYVKVTQFTGSTIPDFKSTLNNLQQVGLNGLVLDLRGNPGGALEAAVAMVDMFVDDGIIVSTQPRTGEPTIYRAGAEGTLPYFPMVVLIDGASASASEIVSGALQDHQRAVVLGTRSYGKGSVQEVRPLPFERGTIKYTTAHYYRPSGRNINRSPDSTVWGVDPNPGMVLPVSDEDFVAMVRAKREYEIIRTGAAANDMDDTGACASASWVREHMLDEQLAAAIDALVNRVQSEQWPTYSDADAAETALSMELGRALHQRMILRERMLELDNQIADMNGRLQKAGGAPLLPPEIDLTAGTIKVYDDLNNLIGAFRIDSGNVEMALRTLSLTPVADETP
jgi:carboxyl-terminal processing protease